MSWTSRRLTPFRGADRLALLAEALLTERGDRSGEVMARQFLGAYEHLPQTEKLDVLMLLAERFGPDFDRLDRAIATYRAGPCASTATLIQAAAEARRCELIRRLNLAPGGTLGLLRMREDVLRHIRRYPELEVVDTDFVRVLSAWFNRGFFSLKRIDWTTPAHVLEKIIRYEAVHEIRSWDDLRRRLEPEDRRCYAFFHPALPDEPLIFVEVALTDRIPDAISPVLEPERQPSKAARATVATFYSISNCQAGLVGISFGNFLIRQVVRDLHYELPGLRAFATLSPVTGFVRWMLAKCAIVGALPIGESERQAIKALDDAGWQGCRAEIGALRPTLESLLARYLIDEKNAQGKPLDPVARFHLGNGARLERVNWMANVSARGITEAAGFMVNYVYDLSHIERNHELYARQHRVVAAKRVLRLLIGNGSRER